MTHLEEAFAYHVVRLGAKYSVAELVKQYNYRGKPVNSDYWDISCFIYTERSSIDENITYLSFHYPGFRKICYGIELCKEGDETSKIIDHPLFWTYMAENLKDEILRDLKSSLPVGHIPHVNVMEPSCSQVNYPDEDYYYGVRVYFHPVHRF